ncbi:MAG TPA: penicillin acylase family protein [Ktedonobacteraceae bacterium]|nr:penicillin acylase family protein [Ktedonobacteraceae bacterium]
MKRGGLYLRILHLLLSLIIGGGIIYVSAAGVGPIPALGPALNPGTGVLTAANDAKPIQNETLHFAGLHKPVTIIFDANGVPHIQAATDDDLFWAIGYLQARFRLTEMDLTRRQGEGLLSEVFGSEALSSDEFENTLGLENAAQADWQLIPADSLIRQLLQEYANGVNAWIKRAEENHSLPFIFKLLNYQPRPWTPIDVLVIQGVMTQELDFSTTSLDYAMMVKALGYNRTMQWFPVLPPDAQHPYDTGPYQQPATPTPLPSQLALSQGAIQSIAAIDQQVQALPNAMLDGSASNNWAVNGPKTASGNALMAGDPHLNLTLPSVWYQLDARSPGFSFSGASIPGVHIIPIGYNQHISWSLTDVQNESTLYYTETTDAAHPSQYYWNNAWRPMQRQVYSIPVKGHSPVHQVVYSTIHGPILSADQSGIAGQTISVDWMGSLPSTDIEALIGVLKAANFSQFRDALSMWVAPTLNFVYADDQGNIGMIAPGYYPIVKSGAPWLPLPGTGEADVAGSIPYSAVPQVYDPPDHIVFSANQRPVGSNYPYYIGTTWSDFDNGYRADEIVAELSSKQHLTLQDMEQMQNSLHDYLSGLIVPELLKTLQPTSLSSNEQQAEALLQSWNGNMDADSPAASIWWTFWTRYLADTFDPWWKAYHVPTSQDSDLAVNPGQSPLDEDLETWTLSDPTNPAFTLPDGTKRNAGTVMLQAFKESIEELNKTLGNDPTKWAWGKLESRKISSLLGSPELSYGPQASGGDDWTINATEGSLLSESDPTQRPSHHGPSWRMIVDWGSRQAESVYPGGQDENPASPWYENEIKAWVNGSYYPMIDASTARRQPSSVIWTVD